MTQPVEDDPPYGWKVFIDDGSGLAQIYLNASTNIDSQSPLFKPGRKIRVTGFGNQYGAVYEVDPRSRRDVRARRSTSRGEEGSVVHRRRGASS